MVVLFDEIVMSIDEFDNATEYTAAEPIFGEVAKEAFDLIKPGRTGWREIDI